MTLKSLTRYLAVAGMLVAIAAVFLALSYEDGIRMILGGIAFAVLQVLPFALLWKWAGNDWPLLQRQFVLAGTLAALAFSLYGYYDFFFGKEKDAQDALVFAVLPIYELAGAGILRLAIAMMPASEAGGQR